MISLLTMVLNAFTSALVYGLKAFFSLISWFFKSFFKVLKLLYVALPVTCIVFMALLCVNLFILLGNFESLNNFVDEAELTQDAFVMLNRSKLVTVKIFSELIEWWQKSVLVYRGTIAYVFLLTLTILMFIPVVSILLCFSAISSFNIILFFFIVVDAVLYLLRAILGKSFIRQAMDRYYKLFPEAGRRHYEKNYDKWLKKKNREIEDEKRGDSRRRKASFYEEDDDDYGEDEEIYEDDEADYYEETRRKNKRYGGFHKNHRYVQEHDFEEIDYDEEDYIEEYNEDYDEEYYEDEDYDEDYEEDYDEDFEDDYDDPRGRNRREESDSRISAASSGTFDFFAGCSSKESADKKYKSLVKLYHPDNMDGDTAALQEINAQYAQVKKRF